MEWPSWLLSLIHISGKLLGRNMLIYGLGGVSAPFVGIKIIDVIMTPLLTVLGLGL